MIRRFDLKSHGRRPGTPLPLVCAILMGSFVGPLPAQQNPPRATPAPEGKMNNPEKDLFVELGIRVPAAQEGQPAKRSIGEIVVNVSQDGTIVVNSITLTADQLFQKLKVIKGLYPDQAVILRGDVKAEYIKIAELLDICQKAGIWNLRFETKKPENQPKK